MQVKTNRRNAKLYCSFTVAFLEVPRERDIMEMSFASRASTAAEATLASNDCYVTQQSSASNDCGATQSNLQLVRGLP